MKAVLDSAYILCTILGAAVIASNTGHQFYGYILFLLSSICGIILLNKASNVSWSMYAVGYYFVFINTIGIVRS